MRIRPKHVARIGTLRAIVLVAAVSACGKTSNSVASANDPRGKSGARNDDASSRINTGTRDAGIGGAHGDDGGTPDSSAPGTGGTAPAGGSGGVPIADGASAATGGSDAASSTGGFNSLLDPHAEERRQLADESCSLGQKFPCLHLVNDFGDGGFDANLCRDQTEAESYQRYNTSCWDEWVAHMNCGIHRTDYCPCTDGTKNYCTINPQLGNFGNGCLDTKNALDACENSLDNWGVEKGTAGDFEWQANAGGGCQVLSLGASVVNEIGALCSGPPAGGQSCYCNANGHQIFDLVDLTLNGGAYLPWYADSCQDAAKRLAAGLCTDLLSCCFRYDWKTLDGQNVDTCGCGSDPSRVGYASCEEFAAAANGTIVDMCVEWQTPGDFPIVPKKP